MIFLLFCGYSLQKKMDIHGSIVIPVVTGALKGIVMNILNDNWLYVRYLTNEVKQISVRQAFIDAENIQNIETPVFHNTKVSIYDVPIIQFLSTLLLAVYFKPEQNFIAGSKYFSKNLITNGWDEQLILDYFDKWEDRFNLFDDTYPFMQDTKLKDRAEATDDLSYISRTNLVAPGSNNVIFEHNSQGGISIEQYKPTLDELVYILLYTRTMGTSPIFIRYPHKSLCANTTLFLVNYGKNLKETIIYNCLPLRHSVKEGFYDRPIWELDSFDEISNYEIETLSNNVLICSFFPSLPIYIKYQDGEVQNMVLSNSTEDGLISKEMRESLSSAYAIRHPWAIRTSLIDKDTKKEIEKYKEWTKSIKLINLCIDVTKKMPSGCGCNLVSSEYQANKHAKSIIYYRQYDGMKSNVLSFGKYEISQDIFDTLQNEDNHEKAIQFQTYFDKIQKKFNDFIDTGISRNVLEDCKLKFSKYTEHYFLTDFCVNITNEDIVKTTINNLCKEAKRLIKSLETVTTNPLKYAMAYKRFGGGLYKLQEELNV